jgi:hypothetical protein
LRILYFLVPPLLNPPNQQFECVNCANLKTRTVRILVLLYLP